MPAENVSPELIRKTAQEIAGEVVFAGSDRSAESKAVDQLGEGGPAATLAAHDAVNRFLGKAQEDLADLIALAITEELAEQKVRA